MSLGQAILLQAAVVLVAVDHQRLSSAQSPADVCPDDLRQTICSSCSSVDPENRCCSDGLVYRLCVDRLVKLNSASRGSADSPMSPNKRTKFFLGKRVKYFLGKRGYAPSLPSTSEEELSRLYDDQIKEEEEDKRAKYFLGK